MQAKFEQVPYQYECILIQGVWLYGSYKCGKTFWKLKKRHENGGSDVTKFLWQRIPPHIRTEMVGLHHRSQRHWWRWDRNFIHGSEEWSRTENKTWLPQTNIYAVSEEVFRDIEKKKKIMYLINETDINQINSPYVKINFHLITSFLKELHLFQLRNYRARFTFVALYTHRNGYWNGTILLEMSGWIFLRYSQLCWIKGHVKFLHTRSLYMVVQVMHVAVNMNCI